MKKLMYLAAALLVMVGCKNNQNEPEAPIQGETFSAGQRVTITVGEDQVKAPVRKVNGTVTSTGIDFTWEENDSLFITVGSNTAIFRLTKGAGTANGTFEGEMPAGGETFTAEYGTDNNKNYMAQPYVENGISKQALYAKAENCVVAGGKSNIELQVVGRFAVCFNLLGSCKVSVIKITPNVPHSPARQVVKDVYNVWCETPVQLNKTTATKFIFFVPTSLSGVELAANATTVVDDNGEIVYSYGAYTLTANAGAVVMFPEKDIDPTDPNLLAGKFSVSATKQVQFTKANLYWNGSAYKFEASQTDYPTEWNANHVGHFFWTNINDYNCEEPICKPYDMSKSSVYGEYNDDLFWCGIDNPLTVEGTSGLYVLTIDEWQYLLGNNAKRNGLYKGNVTVNGVAGCVVIAPDGFTGTIAASYDAAAWATAETAGLICLATAGFRSDDYIQDGGVDGYYWSANPDPDDASYARSLRFSGNWVYPDGVDYRLYGSSIRLVKCKLQSKNDPL